MNINKYTNNLMAKYDHNRDGFVVTTGIPYISAPEVTGRALDFFQRSSPLGQLGTHGVLVAQAVANEVDTNRDGDISLLEGLKAWAFKGINGLF